MILAKAVNKNYWILRQDNNKIGTINLQRDAVTMNRFNCSETFSSFDEITKKYPIKFLVYTPNKTPKDNQLFGFPTDTLPHNEVYDAKRRIPLYTREPKSHCFYAAGYYLVNFHNVSWSVVYCPKNLVLRRNDFLGPFTTREQANQASRTSK